MDSSTIFWIFVGLVVLWKFVSFVRSARSHSKDPPVCDCVREQPTSMPEAVRHEPMRRESNTPVPVRVYPRVATRAAVPANHSFQNDPKTNRYGELED